MKPINFSDAKPSSIYVFELNNKFFIGKLLYVHDNEIAIEDIINNSYRYLSPKCKLNIYTYNAINLFGVPFAYNGPCSTIAGAGTVYNNACLKFRELLSPLLIKHNINESSLQYLDNFFESWRCN